MVVLVKYSVGKSKHELSCQVSLDLIYYLPKTVLFSPTWPSLDAESR